MLKHKSMHSPEGIEELKLRVVEVLRERIGDKHWDLCTSDTIEGHPDVTSTIGNGLHFGCNLIVGQDIDNNHTGYLKELFTDVFSWLDSGKGIGGDGIISPEAMRQHRIDTRGAEAAEAYMPVYMQRVALIGVDRERFVNGLGWHHKAYYTQDELETITYIQVMLSCDQGYFPWEAEYTGDSCVGLATAPFGAPRKVKALTDVDRARLRYVH